MDFSLLRLRHPVDFDAYPHIRPICLPVPDINNEVSTYTGVTATVTGWGTTVPGDVDTLSNTVKEVDVTVLTNKQCWLEIMF